MDGDGDGDRRKNREEGGEGEGGVVWMNRDGLALGRSLVRYLGGLLIGRLVLDSIEEKRKGGRRKGEERQGRRKRALGTVWYNID